MKTSARQIIWPASVGSLKLWVPAASLLAPIVALAQANACDQLKATLAARIEATGVRVRSKCQPQISPVRKSYQIVSQGRVMLPSGNITVTSRTEWSPHKICKASRSSTVRGTNGA